MHKADLTRGLKLYGEWVQPDDETSERNCRNGSEMIDFVRSPDGRSGLFLLSQNVDDGTIACQITLHEKRENSGAFLIFRAAGEQQYYAAGLGGWGQAFTLQQGNHLTSTLIVGAGNDKNLDVGRAYEIKLLLDGQRVQMFVDDVRVIDYGRLTPTGGNAIGVMAFANTGRTTFGPITTDDRRPNAFVAMQFSEPYNEVYRDAIKPLIEEIGYEPIRVDEISQPGLILNDIWSSMAESSVVIAEVTERNPNVYYELGMAHALSKPTVLLAQKGTILPFDISQYRCIVYENSIPGRNRLLTALRNSLNSVLGLSSSDRIQAS